MSNNRSETVLVLAPLGIDSKLICEALTKASLQPHSCRDIPDLIERLNATAGTAILAEECLTRSGADQVRDWASQQPSWSDFPFIILTRGAASTPADVNAFEQFKSAGNFSLLERPVRAVTLISAVSAALRARRRQYDTQANLQERIDTEKQLARQAEELLRSNADLQQFAYVASHDLQEPLRTVRAYSQLLQRRYQGKLDEEADQFLENIAAGAHRMQDLIQDLLTYSRAVNAEEPFRPVSMTDVVQGATANLTAAIAESHAAILHNGLPTVWGDQTKLTQLLQNLLSNAIKYRRASEPPRIQLSATPEEAGWLIRVSDNGQGIAPQYRERIFGLFHRLHGRDVPGTGIGLAICRRIVEQHHGRLWVESNAEAGSTFAFTLPAP